MRKSILLLIILSSFIAIIVISCSDNKDKIVKEVVIPKPKPVDPTNPTDPTGKPRLAVSL